LGQWRTPRRASPSACATLRFLAALMKQTKTLTQPVAVSQLGVARDGFT
jgi:hypothetical protein